MVILLVLFLMATKKNSNNSEIHLSENGEINFSIDFEATPPSETLSFFLEKNHKY